MHSNNCCITEDEMNDAFDRMKQLLQSGMVKESKQCTSAVENLDKLQSMSKICEIDESNENWKLAIQIKEHANKEAGIKTPSPEAMNILLNELQTKLQKEHHQREKAEYDTSNYKEKLRSSESAQKEYLKEKEKIQGEMAHLRELKSFAGRVAAGGAVGTGVGLVGRPVGVVVGRAAGGVVGGLGIILDYNIAIFAHIFH